MSEHAAGNDAPGMEPTADTGDMWVCGGCGSIAPAWTEGWRHTDAPWCPKCAWLA